jgi:ADP-heptose:LPS heptosyltransferase
MKNKKNILIVLPGGIGNAIMFTPTFQSLINYFENSNFYLLTSQQSADLVLKKSKRLKKIFYYNSKSKVSFLKLLLQILFFFKFDLYISSMGISNFKNGILALFSKSKIRCAESSLFINYQSDFDIANHEVVRNLNIIKKIVPEKYTEKFLQFYYDETDISESEKIEFDNKLSQYKLLIGLHLGSNDILKAKRWPLQNFQNLITRILRSYENTGIIIFGGKNEVEYAKELNQTGIINLVGKTSLQTAGLLIKKCAVFISNDSGLMHLATSVGTFVISIFGPTIIEKNRPYSDNSIVISKKFKCQPCYKYNQSINCKYNFKCINNITEEEVFEKLCLQLDK